MKLLLENWREFVKQEVEEFLPHGEVRAVEMIGSSALSPEERARQDLEKYGFVQDDDGRDIDIEVQIAGITREEAEQWAFSDEADELEGNYNYDVQLRIVENWRKFVSEDVDPKMKKYLKKHPYMEPDQLQDEEALSEEEEFQTKMKKNLPAELDFLLNKGPHNKKEGPGVKNPKKPKFKSAPPGAEGG